MKQSSGKDDYYTFESGPDGPYLAARYRPPFDTMVRGIEAPRRYHRTLAGIRWRWRVRAFPKGGDDCNRDVGDAAAGVFATFKAGLKVMVIKYVWNSVGPAGRSCEMANNPFFAKRDVVLRSGGETGTWHTEIVDPRRDFVRYGGGWRASGLRRPQGAHRRGRDELPERGRLRGLRPARPVAPARLRGAQVKALGRLGDAGTVDPPPPSSRKADQPVQPGPVTPGRLKASGSSARGWAASGR